jgi:hypothetical protein
MRDCQTALSTTQKEIADRVVGALISGGGSGLRQRAKRSRSDAPSQ